MHVTHKIRTPDGVIAVEAGNAGLIVATDRPIPRKPDIQRVLSAACAIRWGLDPRLCSTDQVTGLISDEELALPSPVDLEWSRRSRWLWLKTKSDASRPGDHRVVRMLFPVVRDSLAEKNEEGYPLLASSSSELVCRNLLMTALRKHFQESVYDQLQTFLGLVPATADASAGLYG